MRVQSHRDQYIYKCSLEFKMLDEYLKFVEISINVALKDIIAKIENEETEYISDDNQNIIGVQYDCFVYPESAEMVFCRFLYNNYFLSLWATYETGLKEIAKFLSLAKKLDDFETYIRNKRNERNKRKIGNIINEIFKYFKEIHKIDMLAANPLDEQYLLFLYDLRNIIAHANGRTKDISSERNKQYPELLNWIQNKSELIVSKDGWILLNGKFCRDIYKYLSTSFEKMYCLAYKETSNCKPPRPLVYFEFHR